MALPNVEIEILNNQLGRVNLTSDAVAGLIVSGTAPSGLALATAKQIFTLEEAEAVGITEAYDTTNTTDAWKQIKDFYDRAGSGAELWIMVLAKTVTMATACDKANDIAKKLLNAAAGRIRLLGICRVPDAGYEPVLTDGIDGDTNAAVLTMHALAEEFADNFKPFRGLVAARAFTGTPADLKDFRTNTNNRVGVVLGQTKSGSLNGSVGFALGQFVNRPVQRNIGRRKDGDVGLIAAYMSNGISTETYEASWGAIHNKGYIFFRKFPNKSGYFFNDDPSCSDKSDDFSSLARGRVMDKAHVIAADTYFEEINDDIEIDEQGYMAPAVVKSYQQKIVNAISSNMMPGNISGVTCEIDPVQNLLASDKVQIKRLGIRPKAYAKTIAVPIGFDNPINS